MSQLSRRAFHRLVLMGLSNGLVLTTASKRLLAQESAIALQPLAAQIRRLLVALESAGEPFPPTEVAALNSAFTSISEEQGVDQIQSILDQHVLINVEINPESRVSVSRGQAKAQLVEQGWRTFLVKVRNRAGDTSVFRINCPQARPMGRVSANAIAGVHDVTNGAVDSIEARDRWAAVNTWDRAPLQPTLSGLEVEYRILQIYSRDRGQRDASLEAIAGAGGQDLGYRSTLSILFESMPSNELKFEIHDVDGRPTTASLLITDRLNRVYPAQGKRFLPDLWFEKHVYRRDGETVRLPAGQYSIAYGRGPEYLRKTISVDVQPGIGQVRMQLDRWVNPSQHGYYSGDTHIHAAGCSHYESPSEGVTPEVMFRQVQGEGLDIGDVLTWAPGYYHQKKFFSGRVHHFPDQAPVSSATSATPDAATLRYDIEVSGFPSSHCGHLVLLRLAKQDYPGTTTLDEWPSWNIPILKWAKEQGAVTGYAHSAGGLTVDSTELPNYLMPRFDSSGANEYIVDVTHDNLVDFISGCDLWPTAELNIWYHALNCGFRTSFAGETDFPCISDEHVGGGRSYVKLNARPSGNQGYDNWVNGLRLGKSYVGDGRSHIFDFSVLTEGRGSEGSEIPLHNTGSVQVKAQVCARLEPKVTDWTENIRKASPYERPYWHLERSRIGTSRKIPVELIVNGISVNRIEIEADGILHPVQFDVPIQQSSWVALRILPSSHTNPIFVIINGKPVRASKKSAEWCRKAVDVCWEQKSQRIRPSEIQAARAAFEHARTTYDRIIRESIAK
jgi:hypothetical protein